MVRLHLLLGSTRVCSLFCSPAVCVIDRSVLHWSVNLHVRLTPSRVNRLHVGSLGDMQKYPQVCSGNRIAGICVVSSCSSLHACRVEYWFGVLLWRVNLHNDIPAVVCAGALSSLRHVLHLVVWRKPGELARMHLGARSGGRCNSDPCRGEGTESAGFV